MTEVESYLYKTRKTIRQACAELGLTFDNEIVTAIEECSSCNIWLRPTALKPDLDGNPICPQCLHFYGM